MSNHENHQWPATRTPSTPATNSLISKPQQTPATNGLMSKSQTPTPTPNGQLLKPQTPVTNGPMSKPPTPTPMIFHNGRHNMHRAESPMLIDLQTSQETLANLARACSPLPPVPPRRPKSCTPSSGAPMRIPLNIVKRRNSSVSENAKPNFLNQNGNHSPPSPDELEPTKQNGNSYNNETNQTNDQPSCLCKSGAHPKVPRNYQNGNDYINIMNNNNIGSNQAIGNHQLLFYSMSHLVSSNIIFNSNNSQYRSIADAFFRKWNRSNTNTCCQCRPHVRPVLRIFWQF